MRSGFRIAGPAIVASLAWWIPGAVARADEPRPACADAYKSAQELRLQKRYREASKSALACASDPCAEWARKECARWFVELRAATPSIAVVVEGAAGSGTTLVYLDGSEIATGQEHPPIEVDPGEHVVRVVSSAGESSEQRILLADGDKGRLVHVRAPAPRPLPQPTRSVEKGETSAAPRRLPWTFYALGGLGIGGLGAFGGFGAAGLSLRSDLDACKPDCDPNRVDDVRSRFAVANVALGVSLVALAGAAILYFARPSQP